MTLSNNFYYLTSSGNFVWFVMVKSRIQFWPDNFQNDFLIHGLFQPLLWMEMSLCRVNLASNCHYFSSKGFLKWSSTFSVKYIRLKFIEFYQGDENIRGKCIVGVFNHQISSQCSHVPYRSICNLYKKNIYGCNHQVPYRISRHWL